MKLVYRVEVVCQQGVSSYYIGRELNAGIIAEIEDHSYEREDGSTEVIIGCYDANKKCLASLYGVPVAIEYLA